MSVYEYLKKISATRLYQENLIQIRKIKGDQIPSVRATGNQHIVVMKIHGNDSGLDFLVTLTPDSDTAILTSLTPVKRNLPFSERIFGNKFLLIKVNVRPNQQLVLPQITSPLSDIPNDEMYVNITLDYQILNVETLIINHQDALEKLEKFTKDRVKHYLSTLDWIEFNLSRSEEPSRVEIKNRLYRDLNNYSQKLGIAIDDIIVSSDLSPVRRKIINDELLKRKRLVDKSEFIQDMNRIFKDLEDAGVDPNIIDDKRNRFAKGLEKMMRIDTPPANSPHLLNDSENDNPPEPSLPVCSNCGEISKRPVARFCPHCGAPM